MKKTFTKLSEKKASLLTLLLFVLALTGYSQTNYYVSNSGNDANSGLSLANAKLTIQNAVNTAVSGDIINVDDGSYNARVIITKPITLQGNSEAACIITGSGLIGTGKGILVNTGVTDVIIRRLTVQNFAGSNGNTDAGIYANGGNNNLRIEHVTIQNNVGGSGFYGNGPVNNVVLDYVTSSGHTVSARGIVIWNGLKSNIQITNCQVFGNNCCGIELQDGSASGVNMSNNNVYNNGDNGMSAVGLDGSVGANTISNNTLSNNGRFGIEIKNPNGSTTVSSNTVSNSTFTTELRDGAGIAVYRRGVLGTNVDVPTGVKVIQNTVSGYKQPSTSDGFGIVIEGLNHTVTGNTISNCDIGIQQQAGYLPYPGDGDQTNKADNYFGRGNSPMTCGNLINTNVFNLNGIDTRNTGTVGGTGFVTNTTTGKTFCSIQSAINDAQTLAGHTLEVTAGVFNEQVLVTKGVTIKGIGASQPVINFSGTPAGKKTVFDISVANVTLDNLNIKVDLIKLSSAVIVSGTNISNLVLKNNVIDAYASAGTASFGSYGDRNAVSINYTGSTNYRVASGGVNNVTFNNNVVNGLVNDGFGVSRFFRSGVSMDEGGGVFSGNVIQTINHDLLFRFGGNGAITASNNVFNGGGIELSDMNAAAGPLTVSNNQFNGAFANVAAPGSAVLRLRNNYNSINTFVNGNTFSGHEWGVSLENYNTVTIDNNSFTPAANSVTYHHVTINTKSISSNSATIVQKTIGAVLTGNTFNGSGTSGGTALSFFNHDNDAASFGTFTIGTAGNENIFNAGIKYMVMLDNQSGSSNGAVFPAYASVIGSGAGALTTMSSWAIPLNVSNNLFDVGSGAILASAMTQDNLLALEDLIQHKTDVPSLGLVTVKANQVFVTTNSFLAPATNSASIQRGIDAASNGFMVVVGQGTFTENVIVNKEVEIRGKSQSLTKVLPAVSNPNCGGSGGGSLCGGGSNVFLVQANNVTIDQLTINGDNPGLPGGIAVGGANVDARNGIITDHTSGVYNNLNVNHVSVQNIYLRGIYASSGGTFTFSDNIVFNVKGDPSSIALFNYGGSGTFTNNNVINANDAIASNWSKGTVYSGNIIFNSGSGIHTDNNGGAGGIADIIQNNQVISSTSPNGYGIWVFAPYRAVQVLNNSINGMDVGLACAGQQAAVTPSFTGNTVDGQNNPNSTGVYVTTSLFGFGSANVSADFHNNFIRNNADGFYLESEAGFGLAVNANNNSLSGNTNTNVTQGTGAAGAGSFNVNMECNWWGTASEAGIIASISGAAVDHSPWTTIGNDADPVAAGFQPAGICTESAHNAAVISKTNILCYGSATGSVTIAFDNGFGPYSYTLDGATPVIFTGSPFTINDIPSGTHTVVVTDGGGSTTVNFTLTQPAAALTANFTFTPILCNGDQSTQNVTITGGTAPYNMVNQNGGAFIIGASEGVTYGGNTGNTFAASYVYTVTDANGCKYVFNANITQPSPLTVSAVATAITCSGTSTITLTANGGKAPYAGTGTFTVSAGTYTYTVTDANGCSSVATVTPEVIPDTEIPYVVAPGAYSVPNDPGQCGATIATIGMPFTSDNCGVASIVNDHPSTFYPVGTTIVTWIVKDFSGNTSDTAKQSITVMDNELPTITVTNISVNNSPGICGANIVLAAPVTHDNCGVASVTNDHPSSVFPAGTTTVTWTVTDNNGWKKTAQQIITVTDNENPIAVTRPVTLYLNASGTAMVTAAQVNNNSSDNCGISTFSLDKSNFSCANLGDNTVTLTVTDASGNSSSANAVITVKDNLAPTVITQPVNISLDANGNASLTAAQVNNGSSDNCSISSYSINKTSFNCSNIGANTVTLTVTDASGNSASATAIVTVTGTVASSVTSVPNQSFCTSVNGLYTIPVLIASNTCSAISISYAITGATLRNGNGNNASGSFNVGVSTIKWIITDASANQIFSYTTVTIGTLPAATITVSNADAFCNKLTLTASSGGSGATYKWFSGSSSFASTQQISLGQTNSDGIYQVTITTNGCTSAPASYTFQKQNLAGSYSIIATTEVELGENNTVASGSVGVTSSKGEASFGKNSSVSAAGSFVKAKYIDKNGPNITITNPIYGAATGIVLPTMFLNTANSNNLPNKEVAQNSISTLNGNYKNLTLKKGSRTTLSGNTFGTIRVEQGAQVTFTASIINIDNLQVVKGPRNGYSYVRFTNDTKVLISNSVSIGSQVYINPDNNNVTFYMGDKKSDDEKFTVKGGDTKVTANIYLPNGKLKVTGGYSYGDYGYGYGDCDRDDDDDRYYGKGNSYVYMTGLFIAEEIEGKGKNVIWNSFDCSAPPVAVQYNAAGIITQANVATKESAISTEEDLKVTVMPNPSTTYFTLKLESKYATPVNMRVMDGSGRVVDARSGIGSNSTLQIGQHYAGGTYYAEMIQGSRRKVVQLIKL